MREGGQVQDTVAHFRIGSVIVFVSAETDNERARDFRPNEVITSEYIIDNYERLFKRKITFTDRNTHDCITIFIRTG